MTHNTLWQVSLNNGETCQEGKGSYKEIEGESSPWQKLMAYIDAHSLDITSLSLRTKDGRTFNLPSAGNNPRFAMLDTLEKPRGYKMFRAVGQDIMRTDNKVISEEKYTVIEAQLKGLKLQIWVSEQNTDNAWSFVVRSK